MNSDHAKSYGIPILLISSFSLRLHGCVLTEYVRGNRPESLFSSSGSSHLLVLLHHGRCARGRLRGERAARGERGRRGAGICKAMDQRDVSPPPLAGLLRLAVLSHHLNALPNHPPRSFYAPRHVSAGSVELGSAGKRRRVEYRSPSDCAWAMPLSAESSRIREISSAGGASGVGPIRYNAATARQFPPTVSLTFRSRTPVLGDKPLAGCECGSLQLHVFEPTGDPVGPGRASAVFFSEGGWRAIEATQFFPQCARLAAAGIVAVAAEYSAGSGPDQQAMIEDAAAALKALREPALTRRFNLDGRIAACGASAGGHLAAAIALCPLPTEFQTEGRPDACVLLNPVLDLETDSSLCPAAELRRLNHAVATDLTARSPSCSSRLPPTLILFGDADPLLQPAKRFAETATTLANSLNLRSSWGGDEAALPQLRVYPHGGGTHGFFDWTRRGTGNSGSNPSGFEMTTSAMVQFLRGLGYTR
jgi:acetyl esterase